MRPAGYENGVFLRDSHNRYPTGTLQSTADQCVVVELAMLGILENDIDEATSMSQTFLLATSTFQRVRIQR